MAMMYWEEWVEYYTAKGKKPTRTKYEAYLQQLYRQEKMAHRLTRMKVPKQPETEKQPSTSQFYDDSYLSNALIKKWEQDVAKMVEHTSKEDDGRQRPAPRD